MPGSRFRWNNGAMSTRYRPCRYALLTLAVAPTPVVSEMTTPYPVPPSPPAIAVVGAASHCGARLMRHLESLLPHCRFVTFDTRPLRWPVSQVSAYRLHANSLPGTLSVSDIPEILQHRAWDIVTQSRRITLADADASLHIEAVDSLIHLGSHYDGPDMAQFLSDTRYWLEAAGTAGVRGFVYLSDYRVYGMRPGQPVPITELRATGPLPCHQILRDAEPAPSPAPTATPAVPVAVLRTAMTVGPNGTNPAAQEFFPLRSPPGKYGNLQLQFLHEYDLARAVAEVIARRLDGTYNLAGDGSISLAEVTELCLSPPWPEQSPPRPTATRCPQPPAQRRQRRPASDDTQRHQIQAAGPVPLPVLLPPGSPRLHPFRPAGTRLTLCPVSIPTLPNPSSSTPTREWMTPSPY